MTLWLIIIEGLCAKRVYFMSKRNPKKQKKGFEPIKFLHTVPILLNKLRSVVAAVKSLTFACPFCFEGLQLWFM